MRTKKSISPRFDEESVELARAISNDHLFLLLSGGLQAVVHKQKVNNRDEALRLLVIGLKDHCPSLQINVNDYVSHGLCMPALLMTLAVESIKTFQRIAPEHPGYQSQIPWLKAYALAASRVNGEELAQHFKEAWQEYARKMGMTKRRSVVRMPHSAPKPPPKRKAKKQVKPKKAVKPKISVTPPLKIRPTQHWQQTLLESVPGVGVGVSAVLRDHFGSASAVFSASAEEVSAVPGVGLGLAENIRDALIQALDTARDRGWQFDQLIVIPNIGPTIARALLAHFGSAKAVFSASPADLIKIKGVGKQVIENIAAAEYTAERPMPARNSGGSQDWQYDQLKAIPNLGLIKLRALLHHFGSAEAVFSATLSELMQVEGLGRRMAWTIAEATAFHNSQNHSQ